LIGFVIFFTLLGFILKAKFALAKVEGGYN